MSLPAPGQQFEGKYQIDEHIGSGGFAEVFKATDPSGRAVAIKVLVPLHAQWAQNDPIVERFEREGQLLGQLTNEHTVRMLEIGRTSDGESPYIVFEYVDGIDLADLTAQQGPMPADKVVRILQQVCSALGEAHALGVMHRDIKPANIMVYEAMGVSGLVKLLDFGIAKPTEGLGNSDADLTSVGMVLGTPRYMAPEQFTGARAAPTSDIYSLGLVAFELVTGQIAVDAPTTTGIFRQQLSPDEFKLPRSTKIPPGLRAVILKMTRKTRRDRYQTVEEVLFDLANLDNVPAPRAQQTAGKKKLLGLLAALVVVLIATTIAAALLANKVLGEDEEALATLEVEPEVAEVVRLPAADPDPAPETEPDDPPEVEEPPSVVKKKAPESTRPSDVVVIPADPDGNPLKPPPDDIEPLKLASAAAAKNIATRALTMGDWEKVIAACKPYGEELTFCARWLADAYRSRGNIDQACYWFETVNAEKTGLNCPYELRVKDERMKKRLE